MHTELPTILIDSNSPNRSELLKFAEENSTTRLLPQKLPSKKLLQSNPKRILVTPNRLLKSLQKKLLPKKLPLRKPSRREGKRKCLKKEPLRKCSKKKPLLKK